MPWSIQSSRACIEAAAAELSAFTVHPLGKRLDLDSIELKKGYRVDAVHLYVDITNASELLASSQGEGKRCHQRFLRFLHLYRRASQRVLDRNDLDVVKVDFQNQRLHVVVVEPLDDPTVRLLKAIAIAGVLEQLVGEVNADHGELADAKLRAGIEIGPSLALQNGTRGDREPLFLGCPANRAAHLLKGANTGIVIGEEAWRLLTDDAPADPERRPLPADTVRWAVDQVAPTLDIGSFVASWRRELAETPQKDFEFEGRRPPLSKLVFDQIGVNHPVRIEDCVSLFVDLDGFSRFVQESLESGEEAEAARILHVIRKAMRDLVQQFGGRKVRYVGDSMEAVLVEGSPRESACTALRVTGALRDMMDVVKEVLPAASGLGLQIGVALGPITIARIGFRRRLDRTHFGRAVERARAEQEACGGRSTRVDEAILAELPREAQGLFQNREARDLGYDKVHAALVEAGVLKCGSVASVVTGSVLPRAFGW